MYIRYLWRTLSKQKMSNFHFDLSLKLSQGKVHHFSGEAQKFSGEVQNDLRGGVHLPSKSSHGRNYKFNQECSYCQYNLFNNCAVGTVSWNEGVHSLLYLEGFVDGIIEWKFYINLLDLTRNSCDKCNFRFRPGIEHAALRFQCSALTNWATEVSCQSLTASSWKSTRVLPCMFRLWVNIKIFQAFHS